MARFQPNKPKSADNPYGTTSEKKETVYWTGSGYQTGSGGTPTDSQVSEAKADYSNKLVEAQQQKPVSFSPVNIDSNKSSDLYVTGINSGTSRPAPLKPVINTTDFSTYKNIKTMQPDTISYSNPSDFIDIGSASTPASRGGVAKTPDALLQESGNLVGVYGVPIVRGNYSNVNGVVSSSEGVITLQNRAGQVVQTTPNFLPSGAWNSVEPSVASDSRYKYAVDFFDRKEQENYNLRLQNLIDERKIETVKTRREQIVPTSQVESILAMNKGGGEKVTVEKYNSPNAYGMGFDYSKIVYEGEYTPTREGRVLGLLGTGLALSLTAPFTGGAGLAGGIAIGSMALPDIGIITSEWTQRINGKYVEVDKARESVGQQIYYSSYEKSAGDKGIVQGFAGQVLPVGATQYFGASDAEVAKKDLIDFYTRTGSTQAEARTLAEQQITRYVIGGGTGEVVGLVTGSIATESLGRQGFKLAFLNELKGKGIQVSEKAGLLDLYAVTKKGVQQGTLTKKAAADMSTKAGIIGIAPAGIVEGVVFYDVQGTARGTPKTLEGYAISGAAGGVSAGLIGGVIARTAITRPFINKALQTGLYVVDYTEYFGDRGFSTASKVLTKIPSNDLRIPIMTMTPSDTFVPFGKKGKPKTSTKDFVAFNDEVINAPKSSSNVKDSIYNNPSVGSVSKDTSSNPFSNVNNSIYSNNFTDENPFVPNFTNDNVFNDEPTLPVNPNPNTSVFSNVPTNVSLPTFIAPWLPLVPPFSADGGSGSGRGRRASKKYYNEFAAAEGLLYGFDASTGFNSRAVFNPKKLRRKRK